MKWRIHTGKTIFAALIILAIALSVLLIMLRTETDESELPPEQRTTVSTIMIEPQSMPDIIILPARVEPFADVTVAAEQAGRVTAIDVAEGTLVSPGDTLLRIDGRLWETGLKRAELAAADAGRELERLRELRRSGAVSRSDLEAVESRFETAQLALAEARLQIERCTPAAPIAGAIQERLVSAGEYVHPGQPLFRLIDTARVKVVFDVSERDAGILRRGMICEFTLDALPGEVMEGEVRFVSNAAHPANNAFRVELWADNPDGRIRAGMLARALFKRRMIENAVILPLHAIVPMGGENIVFIVEQDYAVRRIVQIASIVDGRAVINSGISGGDRVILEGNRAVLDGTPVNIDNDWNPQPLQDSNRETSS